MKKSSRLIVLATMSVLMLFGFESTEAADAPRFGGHPQQTQAARNQLGLSKHQAIATPSKTYRISGVVASGLGWPGAEVCAKDSTVSLEALEENLDCTITDAKGGFLIDINIGKKLNSYILRAKGKINGVKKVLFSRTEPKDDGKNDVHANVTPITDVMVRVGTYASNGVTNNEGVFSSPPPATGIWNQIKTWFKKMLGSDAPNDEDVFNSPRPPTSEWNHIEAGFKKMLGPDAPKEPISGSLLADGISRYDRYLDNTRIAINDGKVTVADVNGKIMATTPIANIINNTVKGDEQTVTRSEAKAAEAAGTGKNAKVNTALQNSVTQHEKSLAQTGTGHVKTTHAGGGASGNDPRFVGTWICKVNNAQMTVIFDAKTLIPTSGEKCAHRSPYTTSGGVVGSDNWCGSRIEWPYSFRSSTELLLDDMNCTKE